MGRDNPISELDLEDDFLFSFSKNLFVYDTPEVISYDDSGDCTRASFRLFHTKDTNSVLLYTYSDIKNKTALNMK